MAEMNTNVLYYGDNLDVLREHIPPESVDLIYLDPPFNSQANYNVLFRESSGAASEAQIEAFEDTWNWKGAAPSYDEVMTKGPPHVARMLGALVEGLGHNNVTAYLSMMTIRLVELHRALKPTGSLYLHCDPTASHYLKVVLDAIFGPAAFRNEISWRRSQTRSSISKIYRRAHDIALFYSKTEDYLFNLQYKELSATSKALYSDSDERGSYQAVPLLVSGRRRGATGQPWRGIDPNARGKEGMHWVTTPEKLEEYEKQGLILWPRKVGGVPRLKYYLEDSPGVPLNDFWDDIDLISSSSREALGYPTQKPLALLERIISASSNPGDVVLDPFCGCGTAVHAAHKLGRRWIGIDVTYLAINLIERRMRDAFPGIDIEVIGDPKDLASARDLAQRDKWQFQWWALTRLNAQPVAGKKKGADKGIDGVIPYFAGPKEDYRRAIVSVKGGEHVMVSMVRDLVGVLEREKEPLGVLLTLEPPTQPMVTEAAAAGFYHSEFWKKSYPRVQIITVEEMLNGKRPDMPSTYKQSPFAQAPVEREAATQGTLTEQGANI